MKKEEFLKNLRKNLSVLDEGEIQDMIEEYEQHIDMKLKQGLSEEAAINDFGDMKELTAGILEAYHVKTNFTSEKKNLDFDKVREESKKATEKAGHAIGKGAGVLGKGASAVGKGLGTVGKWSVCGLKKLWHVVKLPFHKIKEALHASRKKAQGKGLLGRLWLLILGFFGLLWKGTKWCARFCWNLCWFVFGILMGMGTLCSIFCFGIFIVLLVLNYPVAGVTMIIVGSGIVCSALTVFCFSMIRKDEVREKQEDSTMDSGDGRFFIDESEKEDAEWDASKEQGDSLEQEVVNSYQEVYGHA